MMPGTEWIHQFGRDLRYTVRTLSKSPGFAAVMVLSLALSIGANSAIFSVIHGVLLRSLPYPEPDRIVRIFYKSPSHPKFPVNHWDLRDYRERTKAFDSLAAYTRRDLQLSGVATPVRLSGFQVTAGFFRVLGIQPARGRDFNTNDELPGNGNVVLLSDHLWRSRFSADPAIVGRKVMLESQPFTVAGVMPPGSEHPGNAYNPVASGETVDVWTPFTYSGNSAQRGSHFTDVIGRMKPGVTLAQGQSEMSLLMADLAAQYPRYHSGWEIRVFPLLDEIVGPSRRLLLVLLGAVGLVLLIACANAANLLLARATARRREIAVRAALGAGKSRLVRQMLTESLLIAFAGGILGAALAGGGVRVLVALLPADFPRIQAIHLNVPVFGFTLAIALLTGLIFGLAPALQAARADLQQALRDGGRGATAGRGMLQARNLLVVGEVMLASVLLVGAGLMLRSFLNLLHADPGFRAEQVLTASVSVPSAEYKDRDAVAQFYGDLLARLSTVRGVQAAGAGTDLPWTGYDGNRDGFHIDGKDASVRDSRHGRYHVASPDYFRAMGIPLRRGRFFDERDRRDTPDVILINDAMARRYWPGGDDPVGQRISFSNTPTEKGWLRIVGIVGDVKDRPESAAAEPAFWWPVTQQPFAFRNMCLVLRAAGDPAALAGQLRAEVRRLNPGLAVADLRMLDDVADSSMATPRVTLFLVGLFAVLAVALAAIGIFGVISYAVTQRTNEFGLRLALGASPRDVLALVMRHGMSLAVAGVVAGVAGSLLLARLLGTLLYDVSATDPLTFVTVPVIAMAVAAFACFLPARRATRADPATALRAD